MSTTTKSEKTFIGYPKTITTKYGDIIKIGLNENDIQLLSDKKNERGYTNIVIAKSPKGSWYCYLDEYQPNNEAPKTSTTSNRVGDENDEVDLQTIPF